MVYLSIGLWIVTLLTVAVAVSQVDGWEEPPMWFICPHCTLGNHEECKSRSWCDCQHRTVQGGQKQA